MSDKISLAGDLGSGKSTVGKLLNLKGYQFIDTDTEIEKKCGCTIKQLIETKGEKYFRDIETEVIEQVSIESHQIISTGGGAILKEENVKSLKRNGKLFFIDAKLSRLTATSDRPLSNTKRKLENLYNERIEIYKKTADIIVPDMQTATEEAKYILEKRREI